MEQNDWRAGNCYRFPRSLSPVESSVERRALGLYQNHKISPVSTLPARLLDTYKFNCLDKVPKDSRTCSVNQYLRELAHSQWAPRLPGSGAGLPWWLIIPVSAQRRLILKYSMGQLLAQLCQSCKGRTGKGALFLTHPSFSYGQHSQRNKQTLCPWTNFNYTAAAIMVWLISVHMPVVSNCVFFSSVRLATQQNKPAPAWPTAALWQEGWLVDGGWGL